MDIYSVLQFPNPTLTRVASPVEEIDSRVERLVRQMINVMGRSGGVGLAAPQIGVSKRVFVYSPDADVESVRVAINPEIIAYSEMQSVGREGCLSLADRADMDVSRSVEVTLRCADLAGVYSEYTLFGWEARIVQHEMDHLDGKLIRDRAV